MGNAEIPNWLEGLPLAPEFRPTDTEFSDPIAYISKIEEKASKFGICKIIPPLPKPSKKYVFSNLNKSLLKRPELGPDNSSLGVSNFWKTGSGDGDSSNNGVSRAVFTTRQQEVGQNVKKTKGVVQKSMSCVHKQVWQSGEVYTLEQFESKSKSFARSVLGTAKDVSPLVVEAMFWKAALEKPIYVEYANDVPGSAFGELQGQFYRSHRRQRKRTDYKSRVDSFVCKETEMCGVKDTQNDESNGIASPSHAESCLDTSKSAMNMSTSTPNEASQPSKEKISDADNDMQGTAGWKLSNSPWNLQVIPRASGSLTRFMPDDIPGVTSPMIYIGMLFSWFAWHVEDHELHSLNFLHTGSSKTWYSVPGNYAFAFEEVIRTEGYGGDVDQLAALKLLGEKTTLLSPEVVVTSGIPCCRLVQNPGEFVVTFPRAYHVGFSHGFNCGEAANFGTPQWLGIAKEAAVRRATMNHLPMLSHQQLLYLLTMSFISSVPRTLLPGVRSSRLRDRQKEEREILVKQAFIEDMLHENKLLSILLGKEATKEVVLWNVDLLPDSGKYRQLPDLASSSETYIADVSNDNISSADKSSHCLLDEMSLYMENLIDLDVDCDDLPCHFQTDSGALVCVGCGILGFPFMTLIQPTEKMIMELLPDNHHIVEDSSLNSVGSLHSAVSRDLSVSDAFAKDSPDQSLNECNKCWNTSSKFLKPRIFCLEHAVQVVEMLQSKGGANVLIICHSDYPKIKAHARAIAEEIQSDFYYNEVPMDIASPENLALIDLAIDGKELDECEDWTSKLGLNLRFCVNNINKSPCKQAPFTLALGMQFYDKRPGLSLTWHSQKARSKRSKNNLALSKPDNIQRKEDDQLLERIDGSTAKKKLIQYSRRKFRSKQSCFSVASTVCESREKSKNVSAVLSGEHYKCVSKDELNTDNFRSDCALSCGLASAATSPLHNEIQNVEAPTSMSLNTSVSEICGSQDCQNKKYSGSLANGIDENIDVFGNNQNTEAIAIDSKYNLDGEGYQKHQSTCKSNSGAVLSTASLVHQTALTTVDGSFESPVSNYAEERVSNSMPLKETSEGESKSLNEMDKEPLKDDKAISEHTPNAEVCEVPRALYAAADFNNTVSLDTKIQQELQVRKSVEKEIIQSTHISAKQLCEPTNGEYAEGLHDEVILESSKQCQIQNENRTDEEPVSSYVAKGDNRSVTILELSCSDVSAETCPKEDSCIQFLSNTEKENEIQPINRTDEELSISTQECSQAEKKTCNRENINESEVPKSNAGKKKKRKMEDTENNQFDCFDFIRSPCERLRPRTGKIATGKSIGDNSQNDEENTVAKRTRRPPESTVPRKDKKANVKRPHKCDLVNCRMRFTTKAELQLHKRNICPHEGCGKKFSSHKYALIHQRVHEDDRPFKCSWKGCSMSFKWSWARTEHLRVHTGEKPYQCKVEGCGLSFRFISDFSRHRRKTGHYVKSPA